jgi:hypothetical protein
MYSVCPNSSVDPYLSDAVLRLMVRREITDRIARIASKRKKPFYDIVRECLIRGLREIEEAERNGS